MILPPLANPYSQFRPVGRGVRPQERDPMQLSWLRNRLSELLATSPGTTSKRKPRVGHYRPLLEELEDRSLLSVLVWDPGKTGTATGGGGGTWNTDPLNKVWF